MPVMTTNSARGRASRGETLDECAFRLRVRPSPIPRSDIAAMVPETNSDRSYRVIDANQYLLPPSIAHEHAREILLNCRTIKRRDPCQLNTFPMATTQLRPIS